MKKIYFLIFVLFFTSESSFSQTGNDVQKDADELFSRQRYSEALPLLLTLLNNDSLNPLYNYKLGICYLNSRSQKTYASKFLERAVTARNLGILPLEALEFLGDSYQLTENFEKAADAYDQYKVVLLGKNYTYAAAIQRLKWKIEMCELSRQVLQASSSRKPLMVYSEEPSSLSFVFYPGKEENKYFNDYYTIPQTKQNFTPDSIEEPVKNEATIATSTDAQNILLYRNDGGTGNLYISSLQGNKWSSAVKIDKKINESGWEEGECLSADNSTLYFVSERKEGFGGKDIYKCSRDALGKWGKAVNLGPAINSPFDDEAPFIHPNGKILYFSSNRNHVNNQDLFSSTLSVDGNWQSPENIGFPLKHPDAGLITFKPVDEIRTKSLILFTDKSNNRIVVVTGSSKNAQDKDLQVIKITVTDNKSGQVTAKLNTSGNFAFILAENSKNNITYESPGYVFLSEDIDVAENGASSDVRRNRVFTSLFPGSVAQLNSIFFENEKATILQNSVPALNHLSELLLSESDLMIELSGYIDSENNKKYNAHLSKERIKAVSDFLISKGVNPGQINTKYYGKSILGKSSNIKAENQLSINGQKIEMKILEKDAKKNNQITTQ